MLIDQATRDREYFVRKYHFDRKFFFAMPVGYPVSFRVAFTTCRHEYILVLEEDWVIDNTSIPWLSVSIDLLNHAPEDIYGILLRTLILDGPLVRRFVTSCLLPLGTVWSITPRTFHFTNGPCVYRMSSIRRIFDRFGYGSEFEFATRAKEMGYVLSFWNEGKTMPPDCPVRFRHIGEITTNSKASTCKGIVES
jgi:hypothetical protein